MVIPLSKMRTICIHIFFFIFFFAWLASPVCCEPNGLWDWWSGNEHPCWNQLAFHCSPTIKAIWFLFWSVAGWVLKTVCLWMLSYCRHYMCSMFGRVTIYSPAHMYTATWVGLLVVFMAILLCAGMQLSYSSMVPLSIYGLLLTDGHPVIRSTYRMTRGDCKSSGTDSFSPADRMRLTAPAANIVGL